MMRAPLIIDGHEISLAAMLDFQQQMQPISGRERRRFSNGGIYSYTRWEKMQVTLSAGGWIPAALWSVNYDVEFVVQLPMPLVLVAGALLPAGFSSRANPYTERTITDASGASARLVYVQFTAVSDGPKNSSDNNGNHTWTLDLEQA